MDEQTKLSALASPIKRKLNNTCGGMRCKIMAKKRLSVFSMGNAPTLIKPEVGKENFKRNMLSLPTKMRTPFQGGPSLPETCLCLQKMLDYLQNKTDELLGSNNQFEAIRNTINKMLSDDFRKEDFQEEILDRIYELEGINLSIPVRRMKMVNMLNDGGIIYDNYASITCLSIHKYFLCSFYYIPKQLHKKHLNPDFIKNLLQYLNTCDSALHSSVEDVVSHIYNSFHEYKEIIMLPLLQKFPFYSTGSITPLFIRTGLRFFYVYLRASKETNETLLKYFRNYIQPLIWSRPLAIAASSLEQVCILIVTKRPDYAEDFLTSIITHWPKTDSNHLVSNLSLIVQISSLMPDDLPEFIYKRINGIINECILSENIRVVSASILSISNPTFCSKFHLSKEKLLKYVKSIPIKWNKDFLSKIDLCIQQLNQLPEVNIITPKFNRKHKLNWNVIGEMAKNQEI